MPNIPKSFSLLSREGISPVFNTSQIILSKYYKTIQKGSENMAKKKIISDEPRPKLRPALSEEARENQLIALAMDEVEKRIRNGTASSQEICHFLKLGTQEKKLEREKLKKENELLVAKTDALKSSKMVEELYREAIKAFGIYSGKDDEDDIIDEF